MTDQETEDESQLVSPRESWISTGTGTEAPTDSDSDSDGENHGVIKKHYVSYDPSGDGIIAGELSISWRKKKTSKKITKKMIKLGKRAKSIVKKVSCNWLFMRVW